MARSYVADEGNNVIRTIDLSEGGLPAHALALAGAEEIPRLAGVKVTTFAGRPGHKFTGVPLFMDGAAESASSTARGGWRWMPGERDRRGLRERRESAASRRMER